MPRIFRHLLWDSALPVESKTGVTRCTWPIRCHTRCQLQFFLIMPQLIEHHSICVCSCFFQGDTCKKGCCAETQKENAASIAEQQCYNVNPKCLHSSSPPTLLVIGPSNTTYILRSIYIAPRALKPHLWCGVSLSAWLPLCVHKNMKLLHPLWGRDPARFLPTFSLGHVLRWWWNFFFLHPL